MNHQEIRLLLSAFIDDEVTDAERSSVDEHLTQCAECRQQVAQFVTLKTNVRSAGNIELPYAFASRLARSIHHDEEISVSWLGIEHYALRFVFGLAFLVLLLVGITSYNQSDDAVPLERYVSGISSDSAVSQILTKQGTITRDDVMFAVLTK
jgi:anti-sigma factor RsiW